MIIYLTGPVSLDGTLDEEAIDRNTEVFKQAALVLRNLENMVLSPIELPWQKTWAAYMRLCLPQVCRADLVLCLPGWERSRGSIFEVLVANTVGVEVATYPQWLHDNYDGVELTSSDTNVKD